MQGQGGAPVRGKEHEMLAQHKAAKQLPGSVKTLSSPRCAKRAGKRAEFKSKAVAALWFAKCIGLEINIFGCRG